MQVDVFGEPMVEEADDWRRLRGLCVDRLRREAKRYLIKFDDQETEIEKRRARVTELQAKADQEQKAYADYLANLTVD